MRLKEKGKRGMSWKKNSSQVWRKRKQQTVITNKLCTSTNRSTKRKGIKGNWIKPQQLSVAIALLHVLCVFHTEPFISLISTKSVAANMLCNNFLSSLHHQVSNTLTFLGLVLWHSDGEHPLLNLLLLLYLSVSMPTMTPPSDMQALTLPYDDNMQEFANKLEKFATELGS